MSDNYATPVLASRLLQVVGGIDGGPSNGVLRLLDVTGKVVSSMQLARPSATIAGKVLTFQGQLVDPAAVGSSLPPQARASRMARATSSFPG